MNRITAIALALALGCAGSVNAASAPSGSAANPGTTAHQVGSDIKGALHKVGVETRSILHRAGAALNRVAHPHKDTRQS